MLYNAIMRRLKKYLQRKKLRYDFAPKVQKAILRCLKEYSQRKKLRYDFAP
jgi:hypothetical protein